LLTAAPDTLAHQLGVTTNANETTLSNTMTLVGTDADGNAITETVTLPSSSVVETTKYFATVTEVYTSEVGAGVFDIGWVDEFVSQTYPLDFRRNAGSNFFWDESGTLEADIQFTIANWEAFSEQSLIPWALWVAGLDDVLDLEAWQAPAGLTAFRVKFNSYTDTADATLYVSQPEIS
jgi:hypothetical protein